MATIKQYRPAFVTGYENQTIEFNSVEELLKIEFVDNFKKAYNKPLPANVPAGLVALMDEDDKFHQFSISERTDHKILMAEYKKGKEWWVVGFITDQAGIVNSLPKWEPKK